VGGDAQTSSAKSPVVFRDLGSTGYKVGEVSMGCMNMRDPELVHAAIDSGINYLDTAYVYMNGQNEEIISRVMKTKRDKPLPRSFRLHRLRGAVSQWSQSMRVEPLSGVCLWIWRREACLGKL
jgi:hypothetical protein